MEKLYNINLGAISINKHDTSKLFKPIKLQQFKNGYGFTQVTVDPSKFKVPGIPSLNSGTKTTDGDATDSKAPNSKEPKKLSANMANLITGGVGVVGKIAGTALIEKGRQDDFTNGYGIVDHDNEADYKENRLDSALKGMATGAELGSALSPVGTLVGAGVGAVAGLFVGNKGAKKTMNNANKNYINQTFNAAASYTRASYANQLATMAKGGMKIKINKAISEGKSSDVAGITKNLIPSGVLHARKNSIGDKGVPVVEKDGTKILEIEKEEVILTKQVTDRIEWYINRYKGTKNDEYLIKLGEFATKELLCNTIDNTEKFVEEGATCSTK